MQNELVPHPLEGDKNQDGSQLQRSLLRSKVSYLKPGHQSRVLMPEKEIPITSGYKNQ